MALVFYRVGNYLYRAGVPFLPRFFTVVGRLLFGAHIPSECQIGLRCKVAYGGSGIVIHPKAVIGDDCLLSPGVVIGGRAGNPLLPRIGDRVRIFPGAAVLGNIVINDGAIIGANAVVVDDVPAGARVVAPKARMILSSLDL
ncbi:serine O-acetyltransferase [Arthrobacter sp. V1I9]|uniref:serine O-acetyltransferase n=1 Tax=Arthrobacter sp. V1I9 TaxID=3042275 RepID=UPI003593AF33